MDVEPPMIVLADDDSDLRAVYALCLRRAGYHVVEVADGVEALESARAHRPALLLLDLWMPGLNGFEVLGRLREDPAAAPMRVVMLSCVADADSRLECFGAGADGYLVKGMPLTDLLDRVREELAAGPGRAWAACAADD